MLRRALREYLSRYHLERNHQGLGIALIVPMPVRRPITAPIERRARLSGILHFYERAAA
jgi:hypothetical protein